MPRYDFNKVALQLWTSASIKTKPQITPSLQKSISVPDLGVSTAIVNTIDISRRWCKLNFGPF